MNKKELVGMIIENIMIYEACKHTINICPVLDDDLQIYSSCYEHTNIIIEFFSQLPDIIQERFSTWNKHMDPNFQMI